MPSINETLRDLGFVAEKPANGYFLGSWRGRSPLPINLTVSVYTGKSGIKIVSSDPEGFNALISGVNPWTDMRPIIQLDDSLWGSPLGGLILGCMGPSKKLLVKALDPQPFRDGTHREIVADAAIDLVTRTLKHEGMDKTAYILEACPAGVLASARRRLMESGFMVRTGKITGPLQNELLAFSRLYLSKTYGLPLKVCRRDIIYIARHALAAGVPRESFKWAFNTGSGRFDPKTH